MRKRSRLLPLVLLVSSCVAEPGGVVAKDHRSSREVVARNRVKTGLDVVVETHFAVLRDRRVGLITNRTGIDRNGVPNVTLFRKATEFELVALFSPEHGFEGKIEGKVEDGVHSSGLEIHSLYGTTRKPTPGMLEGIDCLVFDIQDIGTRFYTYISTMGLAMTAAAEAGIRFVVLDRPNPIGADKIEGPVLDAGKESFVGFHTVAVRHGLTVGELAKLFAAELPALAGKGLDLRVIEMSNYRRDHFFDETGLIWVNPSPNMRNLHEALLYPGIGLLETTNLSVGRGTDNPFERIGAPWIDGRLLATHLNGLDLPGIRFYPVEFTPTASKFKGKRCSGAFLVVTDRRRLEPVRTGLHIACALRDLFPGKWEIDRYRRLLRNDEVFEALKAGRSVDELVELWQPALRAFQERRAGVLIYR